MINALVDEHMANHNIPALPDVIERTLVSPRATWPAQPATFASELTASVTTNHE